MKTLKTIADLTPDDRNLNVHTERGMGLLAKSLEQFGAGRSIVVDKHGKVIAGNATLEAAADQGFDVQVVPSDGKTLVVVQRTDLELETPQGRGLALADNRVAEVDLAWDPAQLKALSEEGLDVGAFFLPDELERLLATEIVDNPQDEMGALGNVPAAARMIHVHFKNADDVQAFAATLGIAIGAEQKTLWFAP